VALLFLCAVLVWKGMEIVQVMCMLGKTTQSGEMMIWILMLPVPIGAALYGIYGIGGIIKVGCALIDPVLPVEATGSHTPAPEEGASEV